MSIRYSLLCQTIIILSIAGLLFSSFSFAQSPTAPKTLEEAKTIGERILINLPEALKNPWQKALQVWEGMLNWFRNFWDSYITSWFQSIWQKIASFLAKEVEKRKPEVKEEFEKEKQEMKEEIPKVTKSLWERFKELIK